MEITSLNFFNGFKCIAKDCKHSCCKLWEISIDKKSLSRYKRIKDKKKKQFSPCFLQKLESGIDYQNSTFKLEKKRCAFLDKDNLCEMYTQLGESSLCQVCKDHPRYRNFFSNRIELGYSIACEVVAFNVINYKERAKEIAIKKGMRFKRPSKLEKEIISLRRQVVDVLQDRKVDFEKKVESILSIARVDQNKLYNLDLKNILLSLEFLDNNFNKYIFQMDTIKSATQFINDYSVPFEQLAVYFIYKHLPNAFDSLDIRSRIVFCILSILIIASIAKKQQKDDIYTIADISREYSKEIEYSDDNVCILLDTLDNILIK